MEYLPFHRYTKIKRKQGKNAQSFLLHASIIHDKQEVNGGTDFLFHWERHDVFSEVRTKHGGRYSIVLQKRNVHISSGIAKSARRSDPAIRKNEISTLQAESAE